MVQELFVSRAREDRKWYVFLCSGNVCRALEGPFKTKREAFVELSRYSIVEALPLTPERRAIAPVKALPK